MSHHPAFPSLSFSPTSSSRSALIHSDLYATCSDPATSPNGSSFGTGACSESAFQSLPYALNAISTSLSYPAAQANLMEPDYHHIGYNPPPGEVLMSMSQAYAGIMFPYMPNLPLTSPTTPVTQSGLTNPDFHSTGHGLNEEGDSPFGAESQVAGPTFPSTCKPNFSSTIAQVANVPVNPDVRPTAWALVSRSTHPVLLVPGTQQVIATHTQTTTIQETQRTSNAEPEELPPQHIIDWYLLCWNAVIVNGRRRFVTQTIYQPSSQGDKNRYVSLATLCRPIIFYAADSPEWGIPLQNLLSRQPAGLLGGDEPAFVSCGPSVSIRLQWPGYRPYHKQIQTKDYTPAHRPITKAKLAKLVAKWIRSFMESMGKERLEVGSDRRWKVGPRSIKIEDLILVSLHHVSQGSWQPQLRLRR
ncbi:hypothetical protein BS17DRAFT_151481 [Gyrodon lividus]|nr:hypothetical protein BS17DRAFT_151481 [Gyrodon lividus]